MIASLLKQISTDRPKESGTTTKDIKNIQLRNIYTNILLQSMQANYPGLSITQYQKNL